MAYSTGIMDERVTILTRQAASTSVFGNGSGGYTYLPTKTIWANMTWLKGVKAMREQTLDAMDTVMLRTRYCSELTRDCRISFQNKIYTIESYHADKHANEIQCTCIETTA